MVTQLPVTYNKFGRKRINMHKNVAYPGIAFKKNSGEGDPDPNRYGEGIRGVNIPPHTHSRSWP